MSPNSTGSDQYWSGADQVRHEFELQDRRERRRQAHALQRGGQKVDEDTAEGRGHDQYLGPHDLEEQRRDQHDGEDSGSKDDFQRDAQVSHTNRDTGLAKNADASHRSETSSGLRHGSTRHDTDNGDPTTTTLARNGMISTTSTSNSHGHVGGLRAQESDPRAERRRPATPEGLRRAICLQPFHLGGTFPATRDDDERRFRVLDARHRQHGVAAENKGGEESTQRRHGRAAPNQPHPRTSTTKWTCTHERAGTCARRGMVPQEATPRMPRSLPRLVACWRSGAHMHK